MANVIHLILGVTRVGDAPQGPVSGLIYREGDKLKWGAIAELFADGATARFARLVPGRKAPEVQQLDRVEHTVSGTPRFLFRQTDGKLVQEGLNDKLQFSEAKKALLKPQVLQRPLALATLAAEYLEVSRLSDVMREEMLGGERSLAQLSEVLGLAPADAALNDTLYDLSRHRWVAIHEDTNPADKALALERPLLR